MDCRSNREVLAQGPFCSIERCACSTVHVTIGALTLRLGPDVVESIWITLGEALRQLGAGSFDELRAHGPRARAPKLSS